MSDGDGHSVQVTAQWALLGGSAGGRRPIECSRGVLREENFRQLLTRYSPGTLRPSDLPQVTISWFAEKGNSQRYVGVAIYHRGGDDDANREVVLSSYFAVPFDELAAGTVSYLAMYERFSGVTLPVRPREPIKTTLPAGSGRLPADEEDSRRPLAMRAAALLLTTSPVCVLGADGVDLSTRLRFIEAVASFLPYGMRSGLSASTLASAVYRTHKIRLFFAGEPRGAGDRLVTWNQLDDAPIDDVAADEYLALLRAEKVTPARLAGQHTPVGFDRRGVLQTLERSRALADSSSRRMVKSRLSPVARPVKPAGNADKGAVVADLVLDTTTMAIDVAPVLAEPALDLATAREVAVSSSVALRYGEATLLRSALAELKRFRPDGQFKTLIVECGLFRSDSAIDAVLLRTFYGELLRLAGPVPLTYARYREVETYAEVKPAERLPVPLALAVLDVGVRGSARLLALNALDDAELRSALAAQPISPADSVALMVDGELDPAYARVVRDVAVKNLKIQRNISRADRADFNSALERHRLVSVLLDDHTDEPEYLLSVLTELFRFGYSGAMDSVTVRRFLTSVPVSAAAPLIGAMLRAVSPESRTALIRFFALYALANAGLAAETVREFRDLIAEQTHEVVATAAAQNDGRATSARPVGAAGRKGRQAGKRDRSWVLGLVIVGLLILSVIGLVNFFVHVL